MTRPHPQLEIPPQDPYRDWLRKRLGQELGLSEAEHFIQTAIQRRGWKSMRPLGPRDVIAVLQDVYQRMAETIGEARADKWLQRSSDDLASLAERIPMPVEVDDDAPADLKMDPAPLPASWGRRAHDLPLLLARVHSEIATRSLNAIRGNPVLHNLERAAQWDVQATQAEVRRWETEDMLIQLRAEHSRIEVSDQVASARAQVELLRQNVQELEKHSSGQDDSTLAHSRLMLTQTQAFLEAFAPLIDEKDADSPLTMLEIDLQHAHFSLGVPLHPNVLRARHSLNFALWQHGQDEQAPAVKEARRMLYQAEEEAEAQLEETLDNARMHQANLRELVHSIDELEQRALDLNQQQEQDTQSAQDADVSTTEALQLAQVRLEWRQTRAAARIQSHRMEEAVKLLEALVSDSVETETLADTVSATH